MEIKQLLLNRFKEDPLYKYLVTKRDEEELFPVSVITLNVAGRYSTIDVARILDRNDNDVRNIMKLLIKDEYLVDSRVGRNYKLDIYDVYKIFLANLICSKQGFNYTDVKFALGLIQDVHKGKNTPSEVASDIEHDFLLNTQTIQILEAKIDILNAKNLELSRNLLKLYEFAQKISEIELQMLKLNDSLLKLVTEERITSIKYFELENEITLLNNEFRNDLNQVKWNRLLTEMLGDRKSYFKKQNEIINITISELIDLDVEERLAKSKEKVTEKSIELVALEIKLAALKKDIEEKRNELKKQMASKESVLLASKKIVFAK
ncbi:hypothetical protein MKX47_17260 [Solibacillus sp. FSL R7-0668]|uniref:hypothetical protein n=1 Tax=Solibacillus sp. FSL R7-0668 TaxID=2921688 RepID=UPI0030FBEFDB